MFYCLIFYVLEDSWGESLKLKVIQKQDNWSAAVSSYNFPEKVFIFVAKI